MRHLRRIVVFGLGLAFLAACTGEIMQSRIERPGANLYFSQGARSGEMLAVVVGNPFSAPKPVVEQAVTDAMQGKHHGPRTRFTTRPGPDARTNHRIVMAFNTPRSFHPDRLCGDPAAIPSEPTGERLRLYAGYCVENALYSQARISIPATQSPDDPRFHHMIASAMWELVPFRDPFDDNRCQMLSC